MCLFLFWSLNCLLVDHAHFLLWWSGSSQSLSPDTLRDQIRRASKLKDKEGLERLIDEAEAAGYPELGSDLRKARKSLESLGGGRGG